jgi:hypothetical protein
MRRARIIASAGSVLLAVGIAQPALAADTRPPVIRHVPITKVVRGETLIITSHFQDESEIFGPTVWYRPVGTKTYLSAEMIRKTEDIWGAAIPVTGDIEYWIEVYDEFGNGPSRAGSPDHPFVVKMVEPAPIYKAPAAAAAPPPEPAEETPPPPAPVKHEKATKAAPPATAGEEAGNDLATPPGEPEAKAPDQDLSLVPQSLVIPPASSDKTAGNGPFNPQIEEPRDTTPVYRKWWFITGVSVVGVAAITTAAILLQPKPVYRNVFGTTLRPQ